MWFHLLVAVMMAWLVECSAPSGVTLTVNSVSKLLASLRQRLSSSCVLLLYGDDQHPSTLELSWFLSTLGKFLAEEYVTSSSVPVQNSDSRLTCRNKRPLVVLFGSSFSVQQYFVRTSAVPALKNAAWMLFLNSSIPLEDFFRTIYVPLDQEVLVAHHIENSVVLTEVYHIAKGLSLKSRTFGIWLLSKNTEVWTDQSLNHRRSDLDGFKFRVTSREDLDKLVMCQDDYRQNSCPLFTRVWDEISSSLNCGRTVYMNAPDGMWGLLTENGSWSGMAGMVVDGLVDVAADWFTMTEERLQAMEYSTPVLNSKLHVYIGHNGLRDPDWDTYLKPFSRTVWQCLLSTMALITLFMPLMNLCGRKWSGKTLEPQCETFDQSLYCVFGALCQKGHDVTPNGPTGRLVYLTLYMSSMVLMASYSASLISIITTVEDELPFNSFQELYDLGTYPLGMSPTSAYPEVFKNSKNSLLRNIYYKLILPYLPLAPQNATDRGHKLCSMRYSYLASGLLQFEMNSYGKCNIVPIHDASFAESLAMLLPKESPYRRIINYKLERLREVGILKQVTNFFYREITNSQENTFIQVEILDVLPVIVVFIGGIALSIFVLILELNTQRIKLFLQTAFSKISKWTPH